MGNKNNKRKISKRRKNLWMLKVNRDRLNKNKAKEDGTPAESLETEWLSCQTDVNKLVQRKGAIKGSLFSNEEIGWLAHVTDEIEEAKDTTNDKDTDSDTKNDLPIAEPLHIIDDDFEELDVKENVDSDIELDIKKNDDASKHIPQSDWVITKLLCRCCHAEGDFTSVQQEATDENMFEDMLSSCFNIQLLAVSRAERSCLRALCALCAARLRDAHAFNQQVRACEQRFYELYTNKCIKVPVPEEVVEIKFEELPDGGDDSDMCAENDLAEKPKGKQNVTRSGRKIVEPKKKEEPKGRKPTPKRKKEPKTARTVGDAAKSKRKEKKKKSDISATPERVEHRVNLTAILQYSNASPFRDKTAKGFSCLYCAKYFPSIDDLRIHTAQQTEKDKLNSIIDYKLSYNPIKVDITDLECRVCCVPMTDLNDLKDHLRNVHKKTIHKDIKDIILPFRLEDGLNFTCVVCSAVHISFKNLYHHMSSHYANYCCKKCGLGYITIAALRKHGKTHAQGIFPCDLCGKTFTTLIKKRNHEKGVHTSGWLRNKCSQCPEIFASYYERNEHLVQAHNAIPVIHPCNACNKIYKKKYDLNRHIRHQHLQQKSFVCDLCNAKFFSKRGLTDHLVRHNGSEMASCDVCGKTFTRTRTLKEHMKIHENDARYQCDICKKTFVQKCSLKSHIRLHQDDLDIFKEFEDVKHLIDNREMTLKQIAAENKKKALAEKQLPHFVSL